MNINYLLKTALLGLWTNKSRSLLTILGIVISIAAIILIMSLGQGAQDLILNQVQGLGSRTIAIIPGRQPKSPMDPAIADSLLSNSLKKRDLKLLEQKINVPTASRLIPVVFGSANSSYSNQTYRLTILGSTPLIAKIFDTTLKKGAFFTDDDVRSHSDVVIIGSKVKKELFGLSSALGKTIKIKNRNFRVVGIFPKKGQASFFNFDEMAIAPYTTVQQYILGIKYYNRIIVEAKSEKLIKQTVKDITRTLRNSHNITDPSKDDFFVETQADMAERLKVITDILTLFLTAMVSIALLVGGIGIMNIMLVSVTERTREIGLRKALGATERNILVQFVLESFVLTVLGGVVGIIFGTLASFAISIILTKVVGLAWSFSFPFMAVFLGLGVSMFVGIVFGLYPARKASLKSPMEALRYE